MKIVSFFLFAVIFASCKEISFREPQPKGRRSLSSIPKRLHGKYLPYQEDGKLSLDTVIISQRGYRFGYFDDIPPLHHQDRFDEGTLGDSLILKSYRGYYFLNFFEEPEWLLRVIQQERNGDLVYMAMEQENVDFNDYIRKLSNEIGIDSIQIKNEMLYHIDPSPSKLIDLIEKGFFTHTKLKKIQ